MTTATKSFVARHRFARITARKGRYVIDMIRGMNVNDAMHLLENSPRRAAVMIRKVLQSAIANASQDPAVQLNRLAVSECMVDDGPLLQGRMRWRPGPQGRAFPIRKRTCHILIRVGEEDRAKA